MDWWLFCQTLNVQQRLTFTFYLHVGSCHVLNATSISVSTFRLIFVISLSCYFVFVRCKLTWKWTTSIHCATDRQLPVSSNCTAKITTAHKSNGTTALPTSIISYRRLLWFLRSSSFLSCFSLRSCHIMHHKEFKLMLYTHTILDVSVNCPAMKLRHSTSLTSKLLHS